MPPCLRSGVHPILKTGTTGTFTAPLRVAETFPVPKGEPL